MAALRQHRQKVSCWLDHKCKIESITSSVYLIEPLSETIDPPFETIDLAFAAREMIISILLEGFRKTIELVFFAFIGMKDCI